MKLRNPVVLVLVALPAATLLAGVVTLGIIGRGGLDRVGDPVRRTAQVQQVDLAADEAARHRGLSGRLRLDAGGARVRVTGDVDPTTLRLQLEHPIDAAGDREILLAADGRGWTGRGFDPDVGWRVAVTPADGSWRLVSRWQRGDTMTTLEPALAHAAHGHARR